MFSEHANISAFSNARRGDTRAHNLGRTLPKQTQRYRNLTNGPIVHEADLEHGNRETPGGTHWNELRQNAAGNCRVFETVFGGDDEEK